MRRSHPEPPASAAPPPGGAARRAGPVERVVGRAAALLGTQLPVVVTHHRIRRSPRDRPSRGHATREEEHGRLKLSVNSPQAIRWRPRPPLRISDATGRLTRSRPSARAGLEPTDASALRPTQRRRARERRGRPEGPRRPGGNRPRRQRALGEHGSQRARRVDDERRRRRAHSGARPSARRPASTRAQATGASGGGSQRRIQRGRSVAVPAWRISAAEVERKRMRNGRRGSPSGNGMGDGERTPRFPPRQHPWDEEE
jgi:hypothetical protein